MENIALDKIEAPPRTNKPNNMMPRDAASMSSTNDLADFLRDGGPPQALPAMRRQPSRGGGHHHLAEERSSIEKQFPQYSIGDAERENSIGSRSTSHEKLKHNDTNDATDSDGDGLLYRDGALVKLPAPSMDPRDPMNLSLRRKVLAVFFLCFFGALAAAAELILGALLPVFYLEYAGIDPKILGPLSKVGGGLPQGADPMKALSMIPGAPPLWKVQLLASLPVLIMGIANLVFVPLAIAAGRRPVFLTSGCIAIFGAVWAGHSASLESHIAARCVQAIGAGTVESLIPFIIQDLVFVHQRNTWMSCVFAAQGVIIIGLGISCPWVVVDLSWRWMYFITAGFAGLFLGGCVFFLPETKWHRTKAEMNGIPKRENTSHSPRTFAYDIAFFHNSPEWRKGWQSFLDTICTFFYPQILFITLLNSAMIAATFAAGYTVAPALLTKPWSWSFYKIGLCLVPILIAAVFVALLTGFLGDWTANLAAKTRGKRIPENQLLNLALPTISALVGAIIFGLAGEHIGEYHWAVFLLGLGLLAFGFLGTNTVGSVYVLECYPHLAGPALVNIASFRCLIAFVLSFRVSEWVSAMGYLDTMLIYVGIIATFGALIPVVYIFGPAWRRRWPAEGRGDQANY